MSITSKLTMLGAAGSGGGGPYWITTLGPNATTTTFASVSIDINDNIYTCGSTDASGAGGRDVLLVKYDPSGVIQWQKTLGTSTNDDAYAIALDSSGNIYTCGRHTTSYSDVILAKYNSSGVIQWQRYLSSINIEVAYGVDVDTAGNVYICGYGYDASSGSYSDNGFIAKYNSSGVLQWHKAYFQSGKTTYFNSIKIDTSGNIFVCGRSSGVTDQLIMKCDSSGNVIWSKYISYDTYESAFGLFLDSTGNIYVSGFYRDYVGGYRYITTLAKLNSSGTVQWSKGLLYSQNVSAHSLNSVVVDSKGSVYACGRTPIGAAYTDGLIVKYDNSGNLLWQNTLGKGSTKEEILSSIAIDSNEDIIVAGNSVLTSGKVGLVAKLTNKGTLTGTYAGITYQASSLTDLTLSPYVSDFSFTSIGTSGLGGGTAALTDNTPSLTSTTTML